MSELVAGVKTGASGLPRRLRILGILLVSIVAVAAPGLFSVVLYTPDGISINGLVTHLLLPTADLLIMLLIVLVARRTEAAGKLDLTWFRRGWFEAAAVLLLPVVALVLVASDDRAGQFSGAEVASRPHVLGRRQALSRSSWR